MAKNIRRVELAGRSVIILGTAHISRESIGEVRTVIGEEKPGRVCVEIDETRWRALSGGSSWESLDLARVIKEGKGFLLLANLALASFQRRMGAEVDVKPGQDMLAAIEAAVENGIAYSLCDREVQTTLRRAWAKCGLWSKMKLLSSLLSSTISNEKLSADEIEKLKAGSELDDMMHELAAYLPTVKEVLIDERDRFLAAKIYDCKETLIVAVVGAGHAEGIERWLHSFDTTQASTDVESINMVPPSSKLAKLSGWILPILIVGLLALGFVRSGGDATLSNVIRWLLLNGTLAALGSALCLAHPLSILVSFVGAPLATLNPFLAVGLFSGVVEAMLRKPTIRDFENLNEDIASFKGFYRNRVTHILLVFFLSSLGGAIGNFIAFPFLLGGAL